MSATYNGDGLRASMTNAAGATYYLYDGAVPICELNASGAVTAVNVFGAGGLISRTCPGASGTRFYTFDQQGSVAQRINASGVVTSTDAYDAWGARSSTGSGRDVFGYDAQWGFYTDAETGLILCTNRYYDPAQGRWLTRDPAGYDGGVNLYGYCGDGPVSVSDAEGLRVLTLPQDPGSLPPGWIRDTGHGGPSGSGSERWIAPGGQGGLDFDRGQPGKGGNKGQNHWRLLTPDPNRAGKWTRGREHLKPGQEVDVPGDSNSDETKDDCLFENIAIVIVLKRIPFPVKIGRMPAPIGSPAPVLR